MSSNCRYEGITSTIAEFGELRLTNEVVAAHNTSFVMFKDGIHGMFLGRQHAGCRAHLLMLTHDRDTNVGEK